MDVSDDADSAVGDNVDPDATGVAADSAGVAGADAVDTGDADSTGFATLIGFAGDGVIGVSTLAASDVTNDLTLLNVNSTTAPYAAFGKNVLTNNGIAAYVSEITVGNAS